MSLMCKVVLITEEEKCYDLSGVLAMIEEGCMILRGSVEAVTIPLMSILYSETTMYENAIPTCYKARSIR